MNKAQRQKNEDIGYKELVYKVNLVRGGIYITIT